jgi:hypothetical protein
MIQTCCGANRSVLSDVSTRLRRYGVVGIILRGSQRLAALSCRNLGYA